VTLPPLSRNQRAARNNALWCDAVCRAHGAAGELLDTLWWNPRPAPPLYPNLITLRDAGTALVAHVRALDGRGLPAGWGVKDSFRSLDLGPLGFDLLFEASLDLVRPRRPRSAGTRAGAQLVAGQVAGRAGPVDGSCRAAVSGDAPRGRGGRAARRGARCRARSRRRP
jgi:hypothetical protein